MADTRRPTYTESVIAGDDGLYADASENIANNKNLYIEFYHIPTGREVKFKAFITDFSDNYSSNWNDVDVYGRMDPISTFQGTQRTIAFSFDVVSYSETEARKNYQNSQTLLSFLYPVYDTAGSATSLSAAPLIKIKFANLIRDASAGQGTYGTAETAGLVGKLAGLSYLPDIEQGFYDRGMSSLLPKLNRFDCEFTVFHTHPLGFNRGGNSRQEGYPYSGGSTERPPRRTPRRRSESPPVEVPADERELQEPYGLTIGEEGFGVLREEAEEGAALTDMSEAERDNEAVGQEQVLGGVTTSAEVPMSVGPGSSVGASGLYH